MDKCCGSCRYNMMRDVTLQYSADTIVDALNRKIQVIRKVGVIKHKTCIRHGINFLNDLDYFCDDFEGCTGDVGIRKKVDKE